MKLKRASLVKSLYTAKTCQLFDLKSAVIRSLIWQSPIASQIAEKSPQSQFARDVNCMQSEIECNSRLTEVKARELSDFSREAILENHFRLEFSSNLFSRFRDSFERERRAGIRQLIGEQKPT